MTNKSTVNLMLDAGLALAFLILVAPGMPQTELHRYVGTALGIGIMVHLTMHRQWIGAMWRARGRPLAPQARIDRALDLVLLGFFSLACVSGLFMWSAGSASVAASTEATGGSELRGGDPTGGGAGRATIDRSGRTWLRRGSDSDGRLTQRAGSDHSAFMWHVIHHASALVATIALLTHLALHAKRVAMMIRKAVSGRPERPVVAG